MKIRLLLALSLAAIPAEGTQYLATTPDGAVVALVHGRLHKSKDDGATWRPTAQPDASQNVLLVTAAPDGTLYTATFRERRVWLFASATQADSWNACRFSFPEDDSEVEIAATAAGLYVSSPAGLALSTDRCATWKWLDRKLRTPWLAAGPGGAMYAISIANRVLASGDGGARWKDVSGKHFGKGSSFARPHVLSDGTVLLVEDEKGLFRSSDRGASWQPVPSLGTPSLGSPTPNVFVETPDGVLAGSFKLHRSTDQGASWKPMGNGFEKCLMASSLARTRAGTLFALCLPGVFRSTDRGNTWTVVLRDTHYKER